MSNLLMKVALAVFVVLMGAVFFWQPLSATFSNATIVNDFILQTADGALDSKRLRGKVLAIVFGYAGCDAPCTERLTKALKPYAALTPQERAQVRMILVSVDAGRDTPARIADYARRIDPDLIGATGKPEEVKALAESFAANYQKFEKADGSYVIEVSPLTYVVAPDGRFVSVLNEAIAVDKAAAALRARIPPTQLPPK